MKRSENPTGYLLLRGYTSSEWDNCGFALVKIDAGWKKAMSRRLQRIAPFAREDDLYCHSYWDRSAGFFCSPEEMEESLADELAGGEDWAFVEPGAGEPDSFPVPENALDAHQAIFKADGTVCYKAYGKHTGEEFWTADFSLKDLLMEITEPDAQPDFPNGFDSWQQTHFEIAGIIHQSTERKGSLSCQCHESEGIGGLYQLAQEMTDEFENLHTARNWDGEFFDELDQFCRSKNL